MDTLKNVARSIVAHIFTKFKCVAKQTMYLESPHHPWKNRDFKNLHNKQTPDTYQKHTMENR